MPRIGQRFLVPLKKFLMGSKVFDSLKMFLSFGLNVLAINKVRLLLKFRIEIFDPLHRRTSIKKKN